MTQKYASRDNTAKIFPLRVPIVDVLSDIFLRAEILCLKTQHIIHHWKELIKESCLVPSFRQMAASEGSYGPLK